MSRFKKNQNIDSLVLSIRTIIENRCSLSDGDVAILLEAENLLSNLKKKKGMTNETILSTAVKVVSLISTFFNDNSKGGK